MLGAELSRRLADEAHSLFLLGRDVAARRRLPGDPLMWHGSIFPSKMRSLQEAQGGSAVTHGMRPELI
ncbi:MAG: hypothetical protein ACYCV1_02085 [Acidimicrobiales bacterium]